MNTNQLMTIGAIGFAGYALWFITRKPGGAVTRQPAQRQRDAGLTAWNDQLQAQENELNNQLAKQASQADAQSGIDFGNGKEW